MILYVENITKLYKIVLINVIYFKIIDILKILALIGMIIKEAKIKVHIQETKLLMKHITKKEKYLYIRTTTYIIYAYKITKYNI